MSRKKMCILEDDKVCDNCCGCNSCDLDSTKVCDNCAKCILDGDFIGIKIDKLIADPKSF